MIVRLGQLMSKSDLTYILLPQNDTAAISHSAVPEFAATNSARAGEVPGSGAATDTSPGNLLLDLIRTATTTTTNSNSRQDKSLDQISSRMDNSANKVVDIVMAVTEEPYITDLDLDLDTSFIVDVTDNVLDLVTATVTEDAGVNTVVDTTLSVVANDWLQNVTTTIATSAAADVEEIITARQMLLANLTEGLGDNQTESPGAAGFTLSATELFADVQKEGSATLAGSLDRAGGDLADFTANIFDLLTPGAGKPEAGAGDSTVSGVDLVANGPDLAIAEEEAFDLTDNVNQLFFGVTQSAGRRAGALVTGSPPEIGSSNSGSNSMRDFTDNVFKMLFHPDELDGLLKLPGEENNNNDMITTNCSVWNATTEEAVGGDYSSSSSLLTQNFLVGELVLLAVLCIPASLAVIFYILSDKKRWSGVNAIICWSRIVSLACLLLPLSKVLAHRHLVCISLHLLLPALVLHEKVCLSSAAVLRFLYIFRSNCMNSTPGPLIFLLIVLPAVAALAAPFTTIPLEFPPLYTICLGKEASSTATIYLFLFTFMVVWFNSLLVDIFCYVRIINYMRLLKLRVNIAPDTDEEMRKMINIINGPSSLLIWLVTCVSMLPTLILQYRTSWGWEHEEEMMESYYHTFTIITFNLIVPVMVIGSSVEMRNKIRYVQTRIEKFAHRTFGIGREEPRADTYAVASARLGREEPPRASNARLGREEPRPDRGGPPAASNQQNPA